MAGRQHRTYLRPHKEEQLEEDRMNGLETALLRMAGTVVAVDKEELPDTTDTDTTAGYRRELTMYEGLSQDMIHEVPHEEEIDGNHGQTVNLPGILAHLDIFRNLQRELDTRCHLALMWLFLRSCHRESEIGIREIVEETETEIGDITIGDHLGQVVVGIWILMFLLTGVKAGEAREMIGGVREEMIDTAKRDGQLWMSEEEGEKNSGTGMRQELRGEIIGDRREVGVPTEREIEIGREGIGIGILTGAEERGEILRRFGMGWDGEI